jgi:hypothetical protein
LVAGRGLESPAREKHLIFSKILGKIILPFFHRGVEKSAFGETLRRRWRDFAFGE